MEAAKEVKKRLDESLTQSQSLNTNPQQNLSVDADLNSQLKTTQASAVSTVEHPNDSKSEKDSKSGKDTKVDTDSLKRSIDILRKRYYGCSDPEFLPQMISSYELFYITTLVLRIIPEIQPDSVILAPGRSPTWHAEVLKKFLPSQQHGCYTFAFSGAPYIKQMPTVQQLEGMRKYLSGLKITPEVLDKTNHIYFLDYIETGNSIQSVLMFFAHWKHDLQLGKTSSVSEWLDIYVNSKEKAYYKLYRDKVRHLFSISLEKNKLHEAISEVPFTTINCYRSMATQLYNNRYANFLPAFACDVWDSSDDLLRAVFACAPIEALRAMNNHHRIIQWVLQFMSLVDKIYEPGTAAQLLHSKCQDDFMFMTQEVREGLNEAKFIDFLRIFFKRVIEAYPRFSSQKEKIGKGKEFENIGELLSALYEDEKLDFQEPCQLTLEIVKKLVEENLKGHPEIKPITEMLLQIHALMNTPIPEVRPLELSLETKDSKETKEKKEDGASASKTTVAVASGTVAFGTGSSLMLSLEGSNAAGLNVSGKIPPSEGEVAKVSATSPLAKVPTKSAIGS